VSWEPAFAVLVVAAAAAYVWFARDDRPEPRRVACFVVGLVLVAGSLNSPLETWAVKRLLLIHLLQNALIADIAPLFLLLGLTPKMRAALPQVRARYALPAWLIAWYGTHAANFYDWALRNVWPLQIEHAILILGGLLFWWPLVSGRLNPPAALAYLGAGFVASSFLGLALIFSSRPIYSYYEHTRRMWGLSPVRDQNLGGILMNGEQTLVFLLAIGYYVLRLLNEEDVSAAPSRS
jgi:putative membrane protein